MGLFRTARRITAALTATYVGAMLLQHGSLMHADPSNAGTTRSSSSANAARAGSQAAVISRNIDGDTVEVFVVSKGLLPQHKSVTVRLLGIDTPETKKPNTPIECGGPAASAFTDKLLAVGTKVALVPDVVKTDKYGRALRYVYTSSQMANLAIAKAGYAKPLRIEPNHAHYAAIAKAAGKAKDAGKGMWGQCVDPYAPAS